MKICLANLHEATEQQVFDQCVNHLLTQMKQSRTSDEYGCLYRSGKGLQCAAGCLIADSEYTSKMDNHPEGDSDWLSLAKYGLVPEAHKGLIRSLQQIHDHWLPHTWVDKLKEFAISNNLKFNWKGSVVNN